MASDFSISVIKNIKKIPKGMVATYGQIAGLSGKPHAARAVSWLLHSSSQSHDLPWQRVVNSKGQISFPWGSRNFSRQKQALLKEGVTLFDDNRIDMAQFQWKKKAVSPKRKSTRDW